MAIHVPQALRARVDVPAYREHKKEESALTVRWNNLNRPQFIGSHNGITRSLNHIVSIQLLGDESID